MHSIPTMVGWCFLTPFRRIGAWRNSTIPYKRATLKDLDQRSKIEEVHQRLRDGEAQMLDDREDKKILQRCKKYSHSALSGIGNPAIL